MPLPAGTVPALISGGANLLGGIFGASGARDANRRNLAIAREQMAFQERMSNTAYQRATKDLQAAGLNRILALGKPASTPAGQTATMQNTKLPLQQGIQNSVHSALAAKLQTQQISNLEAQRKNTLQDTENKGLQNLIMSHGEEVASIAADIFRTVRTLIGNKSPEEIARLIQEQITKAQGALTNALDSGVTTGRNLGNTWQTLRQDITRYINLGLTYTPAALLYKGAEKGVEAYRRRDKLHDTKEYNLLRRQGYSHEAALNATKGIK